MSTRFERSPKFRKKIRLRAPVRPQKVAQLQIQMPLRLETPLRNGLSPTHSPSPLILTFMLLTHVPQLATETPLTPHLLLLLLLIGGYYPVVL